MGAFAMPSSDDKPIWEAWLSMFSYPAMTVADELGVFPALAEAPATAAELAARLGLDLRGARALLAVLAADKLLIVRRGMFHLTDTARLYLTPDSPTYWGGVFVGHRRHVVHANMKAAVEGKEKPGASHAGPGRGSNANSWEKGQIDMEAGQAVARYMQSDSLPAAMGLARNGGLDDARRVLDVGGGSGCFSIALTQAHPHLSATIMELPAMCELATGYIADGGVTGRVDTVSVDMFREAWPTGYDAIFLSNIFHDWSDETNSALAASAYAALEPGGRICLHEILFDDDGQGPKVTAGFSMLMLLGTKGRQYTAGELAAILEGVGFVDVQTKPTYGYFALTTGRKR